MRRQIIILLGVLFVVSALVVMAAPVPRSVGGWMMVPDMSLGPIPWWHATPGKRPLAESFELMVNEGLTAVAVMLRAHPTANEYEDIRAAFENPDIDIIVMVPLHWGTLEQGCVGGRNIRWLNYPLELFGMLYQEYGDQDKTIIVLPLETDWTVAGIGCDGADECVTEDGRFDFFFNACVGSVEECTVSACNSVKLERAERLLTIFNERQFAVEAARAAHPNAKLRVEHGIAVNFFNEELCVVARDLIPQMPLPPDRIGASLYKRAGDPVEAFNKVMAWTGLPADKIFISEIGAREGTQPSCDKEFSDGSILGSASIEELVCGTVIEGTPQYDRIVPVVTELLGLGAPFALVWSWEEVAFSGSHSGRSVLDAVTEEHLSGYTAIEELNAVWRTPTPAPRMRRGGRRVVPDPCSECPDPQSTGCIISWPACVQCWEDCGQPLPTPTPTPTPTVTPTPTPYYSDAPLVSVFPVVPPTHCTWTITHTSGTSFSGVMPGCSPVNMSFPLAGIWELNVVLHFAHEWDEEGWEVLENGDIWGDVDGDGLYEYVNVKMIDVLAEPPN
jgi:hypothetical protein